MKRLLLVIALLTAHSSAQDFKKVGTSGFVFLEIPVTARIAGLGEASVALGDANADGLFLNPASLGLVKSDHSSSFSYASWFADTKHFAGGYALRLPFGVFGVSAVVFDFGSMTRTERVLGNEVYRVLGQFTAKALAIGMTYSKALTEQFSFGVTLKYVSETIDSYNASNVLFDGGMIYYTGLGSWRIAGSVQHFGTETEYVLDQFKMPSILRLGTALEVVGSKEEDFWVTALVDATHPTDADEHINTGLELGWNNILVLRGGYKFFYDEESYSFGAGISPQASIPVGVDFSLSDYGRLGTIVRFTLHIDPN